MGQRWLTVYATSVMGTSPGQSIRKRRITFGISISQRVRDIPNDRFGSIAYTERYSMSEVIDYLIPTIESNSFHAVFKAALDTIPIPPYNTYPPYNPELPILPAGLPPRYQLIDTFIFRSGSLDPEHLYPSDFLTRSGNDKEQLYDKVAGYKMSVVFDSPEYQETYPPLQCKQPYDLS